MGQEGYDTRVLPRKFNETNPNPKPNPEEFVSNGYNYSFRGKIMLSAIVLLFFVVILMLCLHVYARWYLRRARRRHRHRLRRRTQLDFNNDSLAPAALSQGLEAAVLATLPVFTFDPKTEENASECAVCLSEFEPGQTGRVLPKCNHSFHTECIDMWFHSHATCPLCRAPVERAPEPEVVVVTVRELGSGSVPDENQTVSSSSSSTSTSVGSRKSDVTIEVPPRDEIFQNELGRDSPSTQSSFRSPMSRMLSFTRILSRERKESVPPSPCGGACSSSAAERDVERGGQEETK